MGSSLSRNELPVDGRVCPCLCFFTLHWPYLPPYVISGGILTTSRQTVLITGGSTGLGLNAARQLAEKGASVIIVARNVDNLQQGIAYIKVS